MKKLLLGALLAVPIFLSSALAGVQPGGERLIRPILYLGADKPEVNIVSPNHVPVPASSTGIGPGSQIIITRPDGAFVCTANFVWKSAGENPTTYLGAAGHCFLPSGTTSTHGPASDYDPSFTGVSACITSCEFGGQTGPITGDFVQLGKVAYARQARNTLGVGDDQVGNDFGIVEIPEGLLPDVRTSVPVWGGPSKVEDVGTGPVCVYGNGVATGESFVTKARAGLGDGLDDDGRSWKTFLASTPGDSGSGLVTCGQDASGLHGIGAAGILTHISIGSEGPQVVGTTVGQAVQMAQSDAGLSLELILDGGQSVAPASTPTEQSAQADPYVWESMIGMGQELTWGAGPFTKVAPIEHLVGDGCLGPHSGDDCNYELVRITVPSGGGLLSVSVSSNQAQSDFDLFVYGPDGHLVGSSAQPFTPPEVVEKVITQSGVYTIGVNPLNTTQSSFTARLSLLPPPPPPPPPPPVTGDAHIYQGGVIDPFVLGGTTTVVSGTPVDLSIRFMVSNSESVPLELGKFEVVHVITKDGELVYGPFEATEDTDSTGYSSSSSWVVPIDAEPGSYVFAAYITVDGSTYLVDTLDFEII